MKILEEKFRFQFEGSGSEGIDNYTNQDPFPISHILREVKVAGAVVKLGGDASRCHRDRENKYAILCDLSTMKYQYCKQFVTHQGLPMLHL